MSREELLAKRTWHRMQPMRKTRLEEFSRMIGLEPINIGLPKYDEYIPASPPGKQAYATVASAAETVGGTIGEFRDIAAKLGGRLGTIADLVVSYSWHRTMFGDFSYVWGTASQKKFYHGPSQKQQYAMPTIDVYKMSGRVTAKLIEQLSDTEHCEDTRYFGFLVVVDDGTEIEELESGRQCSLCLNP